MSNLKFKVGDAVNFKRHNTLATVVAIKEQGQPYKLQFADGGCIWTSATMVERVERNPWLRRKSERKERLAAPIRVDFGPVNIPNIVDNWPPSTPSKDQYIPTIIGGTWDFNIPSVIVLNGLNIPSVITFSGTGDT